MPWADSTQTPASTAWSFTTQLEHTDPYLLWYALTDFASVQLPENKSSNDAVVPTLLELDGAAEGAGGEDESSPGGGTGDGSPLAVRYETRAHKLHQLQDLVRQPLGTKVRRFEISPGLVSEVLLRDLNKMQDQPSGDDPTVHRRSSNPRPLVGFVDYGCAFANRQFMDASGRTRVVALWDQAGLAPRSMPAGPRLQWRRPPGFLYGRETHRDRSWPGAAAQALKLDDFIQAFRRPAGDVDEVACYRASGYEPVMQRRFTHGTHVMDLATGAPAPHLGWLARAMPAGGPPGRHDADIAFVQLPRLIGRQTVGGLLRANVLDAVRYILTCAHPGQPVVINLSYGGNAGPHDGTSVFEQALDWRLARGAGRLGAEVRLVVPSGNAREGRMHVAATVPAGGQVDVLWENPPDDPSDSFIEFWSGDNASLTYTVRSPDGHTSPAATVRTAQHLDHHGLAVAMLVVPQRACQSTRGRMALLAVARTRRAASRHTAPYGRWVITVHNTGAQDARLDAWCERDDPAIGTGGLPRQSRFVDGGGRPGVARVDPFGTLNSIAHGRLTDVIGARYVDAAAVLPYSGTGPGRDLPPRTRHLPGKDGPARRGPDRLMPGSESPAVPGLAGTGVLSGDVVRLEGTSQACALASRQVLDQFQSTRRGAGSAPPTRRPGRHPDEDLLP